jgi:alcohol dehydrogenase
MIQRKAYYIKPGNIDNLSLENEELGSPGKGEVIVKIKCIGLNFADVFCLLGLYDAAPKTSFIPGLEFAGEVMQASPENTTFKIGDKVMGITRFGAFTDHIIVSKKFILPLPEGWSFAEGSAYLVQVLTAYYGLVELGAVKFNSTVLIHSAAGGVGIWANRIAKNFNCFTIGVVGNRTKFKILEKERYDRYFVRNNSTFEENLNNALEGLSLNIIMDSIGGKIMKKGYEMLAPMGRLIAFGSAHYSNSRDRPNYIKLIWKYLKRPKIDVQNMIGENKSIMAFNLIYLFEHSELMHDYLQELKKMKLGKPIIGSQFPFSEMKQAIRAFQSGNTVGKVVINI